MSDQMPKKKVQKPSNIIQLPKGCCGEGCSKKVSRVNFCDDHFMWFKEGLITKEGNYVKDFDKKYQSFKKRHPSAA